MHFICKRKDIQWWFVNPDTFAPDRYFRINEFSGLLKHPSVQKRKSVPALFVRISEISGLSEPGLTNHHCMLILYDKNAHDTRHVLNWEIRRCYVAVCNNYAICNKLQTALNCNAVGNTLQTPFRVKKKTDKTQYEINVKKTQFEIKFHNHDFSLFLLFYFCIGISPYIFEI